MYHSRSQFQAPDPAGEAYSTSPDSLSGGEGAEYFSHFRFQPSASIFGPLRLKLSLSSQLEIFMSGFYASPRELREFVAMLWQAIDIWMIVCLVFVFASLIELSLIHI